MKMRSIILTDEQHKELSNIIGWFYFNDGIVSEPLHREIKDVKCCKTCKNWVKVIDSCLMEGEFEFDVPVGGFKEDEMQGRWLSCWERK
jgi:hypothetical protein